MILLITIILFFTFILFHLLYTFIPLYTSKPTKQLFPSDEKGISIIIPAYNEHIVIENCLHGIANIQYHNVEILFINDGSTDNTLETLDTHLHLHRTFLPRQKILDYKNVHSMFQSNKYPHIFVIDKENGGKADALNAGIDFATNEIIITLDADCILESRALHEINRAFSNDSVVAAGGLVQIIQGFHQFTPTFHISNLIRYQVIQYLTCFYLHKMTQSTIGSITVIAGAFGAFRRDILLQVNGYRKTVGEDMDITLRIQELIGTTLKGKKIIFIPEAICYTECPASLKNLYKQRIRWQKAFVDCIITYRKSLYRKINKRVSTYLLIDSLLLGTISAYPTIMVPFLVILTMNHLKLSLILLTMSIVLAIMQDIATLIVSKRFGHSYSLKHLIIILLFLPIEVIIFRLTGLFFVTIGTILYFFDKDGWSRSERIGEQVLFLPERTRQLGGD